MSARLARIIAITAAAAASVATHAAAQLRLPPVTLVVGAGEVDGGPLGHVVQGSANAGLGHDPATAVQLGVETASPLRGVGLRLNWQWANPKLHLTDENDHTYGTQDVYRTGVSTLTLDAVVRGPRVLDARPYLLVGGGLKHYDFKQSYFRDSNQPVVPEDATRLGVHLGVGAAWSVGRYDLFVEGTGFSSAFGDRPATFPPPGTVRDFTFTAGFRIPLHR